MAYSIEFRSEEKLKDGSFENSYMLNGEKITIVRDDRDLTEPEKDASIADHLENLVINWKTLEKTAKSETPTDTIEQIRNALAKVGSSKKRHENGQREMLKVFSEKEITKQSILELEIQITRDLTVLNKLGIKEIRFNETVINPRDHIAAMTERTKKDRSSLH